MNVQQIEQQIRIAKIREFGTLASAIGIGALLAVAPMFAFAMAVKDDAAAEVALGTGFVLVGGAVCARALIERRMNAIKRPRSRSALTLDA